MDAVPVVETFEQAELIDNVVICGSGDEPSRGAHEALNPREDIDFVYLSDLVRKSFC